MHDEVLRKCYSISVNLNDIRVIRDNWWRLVSKYALKATQQQFGSRNGILKRSGTELTEETTSLTQPAWTVTRGE